VPVAATTPLVLKILPERTKHKPPESMLTARPVINKFARNLNAVNICKIQSNNETQIAANTAAAALPVK
jgi:hypothetical protein